MANERGANRHNDLVTNLANGAMLPRSKSERRLGVDPDVAAMRVMLSSETDEVKADALKLLLVWAKRRA